MWGTLVGIRRDPETGELVLAAEEDGREIAFGVLTRRVSRASEREDDYPAADTQDLMPDELEIQRAARRRVATA